MKAKLTLIAAAMAISGLAFAQDSGITDPGATGTDTTQGAADGGMTSGVPSFSQLDANSDGQIDYNEAQSDPSLAKYWQDNNLSQDHTMDQSEFSQFETSVGGGEMQRAPSDSESMSPPESSPAPGSTSQ